MLEPNHNHLIEGRQEGAIISKIERLQRSLDANKAKQDEIKDLLRRR